MSRLNNKQLTENQTENIGLIPLESNRVLKNIAKSTRFVNEEFTKALGSALSLQVETISKQLSGMAHLVLGNIFSQIKLLPFESFHLLPQETAMPVKSHNDYLFDRQDQFLQTLLNLPSLNENYYSYYPETGAFIINLHSPGVISLNSRSGNNNMKILFEIFYEALEERGKIKNGYMTVLVPVSKILQRAKQKGNETADMEWLKHTRSNLVNTKIPAILKNILIISEYDRNKKGYFFKVRIDE